MGMIPRAIEMIFTVSKQLEDRGWKYQMEGQFLEVYNEVVGYLRQLRLTSDQRSARKRPIRYQEARDKAWKRWQDERNGRDQR